MYSCFLFFFFNDTATTEIYTLSLHDALPISPRRGRGRPARGRAGSPCSGCRRCSGARGRRGRCRSGGCTCTASRSEEHTSELQSRQYLVCRLLLEKKKKNQLHRYNTINYVAS